jgi:hypothetical protein
MKKIKKIGKYYTGTKFKGSPRMKAIKVSRKTKELFKNPPMSTFNNLPPGYKEEYL